MIEIHKIEQIKILFNETEEAHKGVFADKGKKDPEWPLWYAQHMKLKLENILEKHFTMGELVYLLISAENSHKKISPDIERTDYFTKYLLEKHSLQKETSEL